MDYRCSTAVEDAARTRMNAYRCSRSHWRTRTPYLDRELCLPVSAHGPDLGLVRFLLLVDSCERHCSAGREYNLAHFRVWKYLFSTRFGARGRNAGINMCPQKAMRQHLYMLIRYLRELRGSALTCLLAHARFSHHAPVPRPWGFKCQTRDAPKLQFPPGLLERLKTPAPAPLLTTPCTIMGYDKAYVGVGTLSIVLVLIPSPWHLSAWNSATCYMMMWSAIGTIIHMVGSTLWHESIHIPSVSEATWCDIATKLIIGLSIAIPLSSFSINRRLYNIATIKSVTITKEGKRRDVIIDTILCVLCPIIFMAVHYTMQGHRFDIIENIGCWPSTYLTLPAYFLVLGPPIIVSAVSLVMCSLSIRAFMKRRQEFNAILRSSSTGLNPPRYFRLMALASVEIIFGLPAGIFFMVVGIKNNGVHKWISWADTHADFSRVDKYNQWLLEHGLKNAGSVVTASYQMSRWSFPFMGLIFFGFFGFAAEARRNYSVAFWWVMARFGVQKPVKKPASSQTSTGISIFGRRFGRNGRPLPSASQTGGSVSVSLPQYNSSANSSRENHLPFEGRRKSGATVASLDTSMLNSDNEKLDEVSAPSSPSTSSPHELTPPGLRISLTDLADVSPNARASSLLETPTSPPPRPTSYSRPPTMTQLPPAPRDGFVVRQELDAAQMV